MTGDLPTPDWPVADFDYELPPQLIAQSPVEPRDAARLLLVDRQTGQLTHQHFSDLDRILDPRDLIVANRTRVLPARLNGQRVGSGGEVEVLLVRRGEGRSWEALVRPGRRLRPGALVRLVSADRSLTLEIDERLPGGGRLVRPLDPDVQPDALLLFGSAPLPPYVHGWTGDPERYQTIYADRLGSAAAPTAGLHFTPWLLDRLRARGIGLDLVTLHVGPDTFRPIRVETVKSHEMHSEWAEVSSQTLANITATRARGGRVVAVGTTTVRALESAPLASSAWAGWSGWTNLYITPGHVFRNVDLLITNFHLPRSTLLVLVAAFAGHQLAQAAYREAIARGYRFYSFGDAMLIQ